MHRTHGPRVHRGFTLIELLVVSERIPPTELRTVLKKYGKRETTPLRIELTKKTAVLEIKLD